MVKDHGAGYDGVREARFYFGTDVAPDNTPPGVDPVDLGPGKTEIRLHQGRPSTNPTARNSGTGSAGCLVSPLYTQFRTRMIELYQIDYQALHDGAENQQVQLLAGLNHAGSEAMWNSTQLAPRDWVDKLRATLWLIRPDERPLPA
jgi:hypothetical protein